MSQVPRDTDLDATKHPREVPILKTRYLTAVDAVLYYHRNLKPTSSLSHDEPLSSSMHILGLALHTVTCGQSCSVQYPQ